MPKLSNLIQQIVKGFRHTILVFIRTLALFCNSHGKQFNSTAILSEILTKHSIYQPTVIYWGEVGAQ